MVQTSFAALLVMALSLGLVTASQAQSGDAAPQGLAALQQAKRLQLAKVLANGSISPMPTPGQISQIAQNNGSPNAGAVGASAVGASAAGVGGLSTGSMAEVLRGLELLTQLVQKSEDEARPTGWARYIHYNNGNLTPTPVTVAARYDGMVRVRAARAQI